MVYVWNIKSCHQDISQLITDTEFVCLKEKFLYILYVRVRLNERQDPESKEMSLLPKSSDNCIGKKGEQIEEKKEEWQLQGDTIVTSCKFLCRDLLVHEIIHNYDTEL